MGQTSSPQRGHGRSPQLEIRVATDATYLSAHRSDGTKTELSLDGGALGLLESAAHTLGAPLPKATEFCRTFPVWEDESLRKIFEPRISQLERTAQDMWLEVNLAKNDGPPSLLIEDLDGNLPGLSPYLYQALSSPYPLVPASPEVEEILRDSNRSSKLWTLGLAAMVVSGGIVMVSLWPHAPNSAPSRRSDSHPIPPNTARPQILPSKSAPGTKPSVPRSQGSASSRAVLAQAARPDGAAPASWRIPLLLPRKSLVAASPNSTLKSPLKAVQMGTPLAAAADERLPLKHPMKTHPVRMASRLGLRDQVLIPSEFLSRPLRVKRSRSEYSTRHLAFRNPKSMKARLARADFSYSNFSSSSEGATDFSLQEDVRTPAPPLRTRSEDVPPPSPLKNAEVPLPPLGKGGTLDGVSMSLSQILDRLTGQMSYSYVLEPGHNESLTVHLDTGQPEEVLTHVLRASGLSWKMHQKVLYIGSSGWLDRVFPSPQASLVIENPSSQLASDDSADSEEHLAGKLKVKSAGRYTVLTGSVKEIQSVLRSSGLPSESKTVAVYQPHTPLSPLLKVAAAHHDEPGGVHASDDRSILIKGQPSSVASTLDTLAELDRAQADEPTQLTLVAP